MSSPSFFDPAKRPPRLDFVERDFPFPLSLTYARLRGAFDHQQPLEAVWAVRDAWEVAIKFCACVSVADFLQADPDPPTAERVAVGLLSDRGVAIGGWKEALDTTLREPLKEWGKAPVTPTARRVPALWQAFYKPPGGKFTTHRQAVEEFTQWRNDVFGHGVFTHDLTWYASEANAWMNKLIALYDALKPVFDGWALVGHTADGQTIDWSGCEFEPKRESHQHDPVGSALPLFLARAGVDLSFGPLLSVQRCKECDHPAAFFFDRQKTADDTVLLEYVAGAKGKKKQWDEVQKLGRWLPTDFKWVRRLYDTGELLDGIPIVFRDFDREYVRPAYLLDAICTHVDDTDRGYILLDGPEGTGKSYLARGLAEKEAGGLKVLAYYVRPGDLSHFASFLIELNRQVHDKLLPANKRTFEPQAKGAKTPAELQAEFVDYYTTVLAGRAGAVLVIDALDELPDADLTTPLITDLLPDPAKLPPNLHIVLTARAGELKPRAAARWQALASSALRLTLDPTSAENRGLVGEYLKREHVTAADDILARSGGVFLYAWHYVAALRQGVFATTADLPPADQFYPAFLDCIRRRVGDTLFGTVYRKLLLLLSASRVPVTREQVERWGIPADRLTTALGELRDFVRQLRHRDWHEGMSDNAEPRYKIAHEAFVRYVETHEAGRLKKAHCTIATVALRHNATKWEGLDPADDGDLYDVRFVLWHCDAGGMTNEAERLRANDLLASGMWQTANRLAEGARHELALELFEQCGKLFRDLLENQGRPELANDHAKALTNKGNALLGLNRLREAVMCHDEAITIHRDLIENRVESEFALVDEEDSEVVVNAKEDLALALTNKGVALDSLGRIEEAMGCYDEAIRIHCDLIQNRNRPEKANDLAMALTNKGNALSQLGRLGEAVGCHDKAVGIRRYLVDKRNLTELANDLSIALSNKGVALESVGRLVEAMVCHDEAISILHDLVQIKGRTELANELASALVNKGNVLDNLGRPGEAVGCHDEAIRIRRDLVQIKGRTELANELARALNNKGTSLDSLGRSAEAVGCYDEAVTIRRDLVDNRNRPELDNDLAAALMNKGNSLRKLGRPDEAVGCHDESIRIRRDLVQNRGRTELANELAMALNNKGVALAQLGRSAEAVEYYDEAIAIRRDLVQNRARVELANDLAMALINKANALRKLGHPTEAVECYDEAITIRRDLVDNRNRPELVNALAVDLVSKGNTLLGLKLLSEALECYDECITIRRNQVKNRNRPELVNDLARTLSNKGSALQELGRLAVAVECYDEALVILRDLVDNQGRAELANDLAQALMNKGFALESDRLLPEAVDQYDEAVEIYRRLFDLPRFEILPDLMLTYANRWNVAFAMNDWPTVAGITKLSINAFRTKEQATGVTPRDQQRYGQLEGRLRRMTAEQREQLLAASDADFAELLRTQVFTTPPPA